MDKVDAVRICLENEELSNWYLKITDLKKLEELSGNDLEENEDKPLLEDFTTESVHTYGGDGLGDTADEILSDGIEKELVDENEDGDGWFPAIRNIFQPH